MTKEEENKLIEDILKSKSVRVIGMCYKKLINTASEYPDKDRREVSIQMIELAARLIEI